MGLPTPQEDRLRGMLSAKVGQLEAARDTWHDTLVEVRDSHTAITESLPSLVRGLDSTSGEKVRDAFQAMGAELGLRKTELKKARAALDDALTTLGAAKLLYAFAGPPPEKASVTPPGPDATDEEQVEYDRAQTTAQTDYQNDVADRERFCRWLADAIDRQYFESAQVLKEVHGEPTRHPADDTAPPPAVPPLVVPGGGRPPGSNGTDTGPHWPDGDTDDDDLPGVDYPICEFPPPGEVPGGDDPPPDIPQIDIGDPLPPRGFDQVLVTGNAGGSIGLGGIGMAGAGVLTGGAFVRAALRSIGITPAGGSPTTRPVGLGRSGAAGARGAGVGSPMRGGAAGAGAAGRGARGAGGRAGGGRGMAAAAGSRGTAAGGRGGVGAAGAGGRGRGKGSKANPDIFEAEHDWYENEGQPGILD